MALSRRRCVLNPDCFCYVCGEYIFEKYRKPISDFVKAVYQPYFKIELRNQDKPWVPHFVCQKSMTEVESKAWNSFVLVMSNFLGKKKPDDHVKLVECMLSNLQALGCNMSKKSTSCSRI